MKAPDRSHVVSSFTAIKGAMIDETYAVFAAWDFGSTKKDNLERLRRENYIGVRTAARLRDLIFVLNRRFDPNDRDSALVLLPKSGFPVEEWKPILLWHITRDEFLLRDFLITWLFPAFTSGAYLVRPEDLYEHIRSVDLRGGTIEHVWSETTLNRVATALLKMAVDFGLLRGSTVKDLGGRVAPGDCSPEALTRTGQGDFHHPAPPLMCLVATPPISAQQPAGGEAGSVPTIG